MQRKESRHHGATPLSTCHALQQKEQQTCVGRVQGQVHQMEPAGVVQSENLAVQHERNPGQRMPVAGVSMRKGPEQIFERHSGLDMRIFCYVLLVIKVDEVTSRYAPIDGEGCDCESSADQPACS